MAIKSVTKVVAMTALLLASASASASIEVKAKRMMTEGKAQAEIGKVVAACSNESLDTQFDWSAWDGYDFKSARLDEVKTTGWLGGLINYIYDDMVKLCTTTDHAALYQAEFSKVTTLQFLGQESVKARKTAFALPDDGTVLNISLNPNAAYDSSTLKYMKAAWN